MPKLSIKPTAKTSSDSNQASYIDQKKPGFALKVPGRGMGFEPGIFLGF
jgi:hypothetical protein